MTDTDQFEAWNGHEGRHWVTYSDHYDAMLRRFTPHLLTAADIGDRDRVLDIGCGSGQTTRAAARAASGGSAVGVDISAPLIKEAKRRTGKLELRNVTFEHGDAETHSFDAGAFDVSISRFGIMFFADPPAAFRNIAHAVRPGGRSAYLCWQDPLRNEWILTLGAAIAAHVGMPELDGSGPGPFSLADPDKTVDLLTAAGYTKVSVEPITEPLWLGRDPDHVVEFARDVGLVRDLLAEADQATVDAVFAEMRTALAERQQPDGIWRGAAAWLVTGHLPAA